MKRPRVIAVVPSAGYGKRLGSKKKKPFVLLRKRPIASYALKALDECPLIDTIIVASERSCIRDFRALIRRYGYKKVKDVVAGGKTRQESVRNCIRRVPPSYDIVLIHDAARPFIDGATIERSIRLAERFGACIVAVPEFDTVKLADKSLFVKKTLDRKKIYRAQTPQVFRYDVIKKAYAAGIRFGGFTDDAGLVEKSGLKIKILKGSYKNIKIREIK